MAVDLPWLVYIIIYTNQTHKRNYFPKPTLETHTLRLVGDGNAVRSKTRLVFGKAEVKAEFLWFVNIPRV